MKKLLDVLSFLLVLANVIVSTVFYFTTTEIAVPSHFSSLGEIQSYGQTWLILLLAGISVVVYILMVVSERHHVINLPFKVKHEPSARPYIDKVLAWTNMFVMLILFYVDLAVAQYIKMNTVVVYAGLLIICIIGFYYTRKIYKCGR